MLCLCIYHSPNRRKAYAKWARVRRGVAWRSLPARSSIVALHAHFQMLGGSKFYPFWAPIMRPFFGPVFGDLRDMNHQAGFQLRGRKTAHF